MYKTAEDDLSPRNYFRFFGGRGRLANEAAAEYSISMPGLPIRPKVRYRSQQANSYKTASTITGMLRAVGSWRLGGRRNGRK